MTETNSILTPDRPTDRERAIVACGLLIDCLTELQPDVSESKTRLYELSKLVRDTIREIRQAEAKAQGVRFNDISEFLGI